MRHGPVRGAVLDGQPAEQDRDLLGVLTGRPPAAHPGLLAQPQHGRAVDLHGPEGVQIAGRHVDRDVCAGMAAAPDRGQLLVTRARVGLDHVHLGAAPVGLGPGPQLLATLAVPPPPHDVRGDQPCLPGRYLPGPGRHSGSAVISRRSPTAS